MTRRILVPQPGMEPIPPALEGGKSLNHWTTREAPIHNYLLNECFDQRMGPKILSCHKK